MENFFSILKQEIYYGNTFHSFEELKLAIEHFIEHFREHFREHFIEHFIAYYNNSRTKQKLGFLSPVQYRLKVQVA